MQHSLQNFVQMAKKCGPLSTAVVHPTDPLALQGALSAAKQKLIKPLLIGPKKKIEAAAEALGVDLSPYPIIPTPHSHASVSEATARVMAGEAECLMKGKLHTDELMSGLVDPTKGLRTGRRMSHVFVLELSRYPKPIFLTDAAVNITPSLSVKRDIVQNAIDLFRAINKHTPKVAIVSAVEMVNEKIPSTLDAAALCKMADRGQITGGILDGPLALDNAISSDAAKVKNIKSRVAGNADIIIAPNLEAGNLLYKQLRFLSGAKSAGLVMGAKVPVILTSRAADTETRLGSAALAVLYAKSQKHFSS